MKKPDKPDKSGNKDDKSVNNLFELEYTDLVDVVRRCRSTEKTNEAFEEIERRMRVKIKQISYKFNIPGSGFQDVYQEALFALRYKAIKDYDQTRGNGTGPYPFDKFAILCIRRHLSTKLKSSFQNKNKVMNSCISLDQDRNDNSEDSLFLSDVLPKTEGNVLQLLEQNEYYKKLFTNLFSKLSVFEKDVFLLYIQKYSYDQIADRINAKASVPKSKNKKKVIEYIHMDVKSVDNALSRVKKKAQDIFKKFGESKDKQKA